MKLRHFVLHIQILISLILIHRLTAIQSVNAVCEYSTSDQNKVYSYNLAGYSDKYPHGVLSEDGYYKVSSNGTVVWFQLCDAMIFNHNPPKCFDCYDCGGSARCGMGCSALMSNDLFGYPICTTIGLTSTVSTNLIDRRNPHMGLVIKMWHNGPQFNCSLSVSVVCDSKQVQGPTTLGKVGFCDFVTQLRHPSGCAKAVSANTSGLGWFSILLIIILCLFGGYMIAGATYRFFYLGIRGIDIIPNLELWASLPRKARNGFTSLVRRFREPSEGYHTSYSRADF